jgi:hypothetical protein
MIKVAIQEPLEGGIERTPYEALLPAVPRVGDGFITVEGRRFDVAHVCFRQESERLCSVQVVLAHCDGLHHSGGIHETAV